VQTGKKRIKLVSKPECDFCSDSRLFLQFSFHFQHLLELASLKQKQMFSGNETKIEARLKVAKINLPAPKLKSPRSNFKNFF
jgi:hypothetical protein